MSEIEKLTPQNLLLLLQFVTPGFLAVYFRSFFVRRIEASFKDNLLLFVALSVIYSFVTLPLWSWLKVPTGLTGSAWFVWVFTLVVLPVIGGTLLGVATQRGWLQKPLAPIGLRPLSPYRTGWDWAFSQVPSSVFLLVTLDDGSSVAGLFGSVSLAASEHSNRDLYLELVYDVDEEGNWRERQPRGSVLIAGKTIRFVEFFAGGAG